MYITNCNYIFNVYEANARNIPAITDYDEDLNEIKKILNYSNNEKFDWWMPKDELDQRMVMLIDYPTGLTENMVEKIYEMNNVEWK